MIKEFKKKLPILSITILAVILLLCLMANVIAPYEPSNMDSQALNKAPGGSHIFGTDNLGRDLFSMLFYGGRLSIYIGLLSAGISTVLGIVYGAVSGLCNDKIDDLLMRFSELIMSIPSLLLVLFLQAIWGQGSPTSIAVVIAFTSWMNIAKVVRSEVRQIGKSEYILAAKSMGASFPYILRRHLLPNFLPAIMFMAVTAIGQAIIAETTLSFLGLGLPIDTISWGSLLSMSQGSLLSGSWWIIIIPGTMLVTTLVCFTQLGEYIRKKNTSLHSNL